MPTENQQLAARSYQKQFKELLTAVFKKQAHFSDMLVGGSVEVLDGVAHNKTAFSVKTSDIPFVLGEKYNTDPNVAFKAGTSNTTRFGERTEIIYTDVDVPYDWEWTFHEGIDRHTVNNDLQAALADRLELQSQAKVRLFDKKLGLFASKNAGHTEALADYTPDNVLKLFNTLSKHFNNIEAIGTRVAKVNSDLYNAIVDHPLMNTAKASKVNIDENNLIKFKGFTIEEVPDALFVTGEVCYAYVTGMVKQFTGINTTRTIESEDFDGIALQGAGKAGEFMLDDNKPAMVKVTKTVTPGV